MSPSEHTSLDCPPSFQNLLVSLIYVYSLDLQTRHFKEKFSACYNISCAHIVDVVSYIMMHIFFGLFDFHVGFYSSKSSELSSGSSAILADAYFSGPSNLCWSQNNVQTTLDKFGNLYSHSQHLFVKLPTSIGSSKKQESSRKTFTSALLTTPAFDRVDHNKMWKILRILREMEIPDHLTCLLRNLYSGQEATVRSRHGTTDCFQIKKGLGQGCILSSYSFNLYAEYIM